MKPAENLPAIEAGFRALMAALGCRTAAEAAGRIAALELRISSVPFTPADARILAALPVDALACLGHRPDDFVRFVANVYELG